MLLRLLYVAMITTEPSHSLKVTADSCCLQSHWFYVGDSCDLIWGMDLGWVSLLYQTWYTVIQILDSFHHLVHPLSSPNTLQMSAFFVCEERVITWPNWLLKFQQPSPTDCICCRFAEDVKHVNDPHCSPVWLWGGNKMVKCCVVVNCTDMGAKSTDLGPIQELLECTSWTVAVMAVHYP